jgi:lysine 2,3-aminomutase
MTRYPNELRHDQGAVSHQPSVVNHGSGQSCDESWQGLLRRNVTTLEGLAHYLPDVDHQGLAKVIRRYPMAINPYYLGLITGPTDGLFEQAVPDAREMTYKAGLADPLDEERLSPVPGLTHKYPDRVLFLISSRCAL